MNSKFSADFLRSTLFVFGLLLLAAAVRADNYNLNSYQLGNWQYTANGRDMEYNANYPWRGQINAAQDFGPQMSWTDSGGAAHNFYIQLDAGYVSSGNTDAYLTISLSNVRKTGSVWYADITVFVSATNSVNSPYWISISGFYSETKTGWSGANLSRSFSNVNLGSGNVDFNNYSYTDNSSGSWATGNLSVTPPPGNPNPPLGIRIIPPASAQERSTNSYSIRI